MIEVVSFGVKYGAMHIHIHHKFFLTLLVFLVVCIISGVVFISPATLFSPPPLLSQSTTVSLSLFPSPSPIVPIVYGYLPYWTRAKANIPKEVSHVSYFSLGIQPDGHLLDLPKAAQEPGYRAYKAGVLKNLRAEISPEQKLELTITMMDQEAIPVFINSSEARQTFVTDLKTIISEAPISGINIDIEYNGLVDDAIQKNYASLLESSKKVLDSHSPKVSLSIASYSDTGTIQRLTNLSLIHPFVDHIIMMAYDYHRRVSPQAGPNSPLYGKSDGKWESDIMSDLKGYTDKVPSEKVLLGIPFYGYQWQIEEAENPNSFTTPKTGSTITYENIPSILNQLSKQRSFDPLAFSPYILFNKNGKTYVLYYDDAQSLKYKLELVKQARLGGIAIWALGYEGDQRELWQTIQENLLSE